MDDSSDDAGPSDDVASDEGNSQVSDFLAVPRAARRVPSMVPSMPGQQAPPRMPARAASRAPSPPLVGGALGLSRTSATRGSASSAGAASQSRQGNLESVLVRMFAGTQLPASQAWVDFVFFCRVACTGAFSWRGC